MTHSELSQFVIRYSEVWPFCIMRGCEMPAVVGRGNHRLEPYCFRCNEGLPGKWRWLEMTEVRERW